MKLFNKKLLSFRETNAYDPLLLDYLDGNDSLKNLYGFAPRLDNFSPKAIERAKFSVNRELLVEVLRSQYSMPGNGSLNDAVKNNIDKLLNPSSFTVTTGHQLNIFSGPLYFLYKIITTINLAAKLEKESGLSVVPVYWMASEDHDITEIDHVNIFGSEIQWKTNWKGASGRASCEGIYDAIDAVSLKLGDSSMTTDILTLLREAYAPQKTLSEATRYFVNALFGEYGLIVLDPDDKRLKSLCSAIFLDDIIRHSAFEKTKESTRILQEKYKVQVHPREVNMFYLGQDYRERIIVQDRMYSVVNRNIKWTQPQLESELKSNPARFSPNVVLRPVYQELILPNLATIGGPAEIAYWLEYKPVFDFYKVSYPILVLRGCAMLIESTSAERLQKFNVGDKDLFLSADEWVRKFLSRETDSEFSLDSESDMFRSEMEKIGEKIARIDPSLKASAEAEKQRLLNALKNIGDKILRVQKKKNEISVNQLSKLKEKLYPENSLQERVENLLPYYARYGKNFLTGLSESFDPLDFRFHVLYFNE